MIDENTQTLKNPKDIMDTKNTKLVENQASKNTKELDLDPGNWSDIDCVMFLFGKDKWVGQPGNENVFKDASIFAKKRLLALWDDTIDIHDAPPPLAHGTYITVDESCPTNP